MVEDPDVETRLLALTYLVQRLYAQVYRLNGVSQEEARELHADIVERLGEESHHPSDPSISMLAADAMAEAVETVLDGVHDMLVRLERKEGA